LVAGALGRLLGSGVSEPAGRFAERLAEWFKGGSTFTVRGAAKREENCRRSVYGWVRELCDAGVLERVTEAIGKTAATCRLSGVGPDKTAGLPDPKTVFGSP